MCHATGCCAQRFQSPRLLCVSREDTETDVTFQTLRAHGGRADAPTEPKTGAERRVCPGNTLWDDLRAARGAFDCHGRGSGRARERERKETAAARPAGTPLPGRGGGGTRLATRDRPGTLLRPHGASPAPPGPRGRDAAVGAAAAARGARAPPAGSLEVPRGPLLGSPIHMITRPFPSVEMKWGPRGAPSARPAPTPAALFRDAGLEHRTQQLPG